MRSQTLCWCQAAVQLENCPCQPCLAAAMGLTSRSIKPHTTRPVRKHQWSHDETWGRLCWSSTNLGIHNKGIFLVASSTAWGTVCCYCGVFIWAGLGGDVSWAMQPLGMYLYISTSTTLRGLMLIPEGFGPLEQKQQLVAAHLLPWGQNPACFILQSKFSAGISGVACVRDWLGAASPTHSLLLLWNYSPLVVLNHWICEELHDIRG